IGRMAAGERRDPEPFLEWAEGEPWLARRPWLRVWAWLGPSLLCVAIALVLVGAAGWPLVIGVFLVNVLVARGPGGAASKIVGAVGERSRALASDAATFALLADASFASPAMRELKASLAAGGQPAAVLVRRLGRIAAFPIPASSP